MDQKDRERFNKVYREVENCYRLEAKGCMYTAISQLSPDNYEDICDYFHIIEDSSIDKDLQFFRENYIDNADNDWSQKMQKIFLVDPITNLLRITPEPWLKITFIIFISLIVIGSYIFLKSVILKPKPISDPGETKGGSVIKETLPRPNSILCLVIPSNKLNGVNQYSKLPSSSVKELISSASYFRCISPERERISEVKLNISSSEGIDYLSDEDTYIELLVPEGSEMIANDTKFSLRKNVPDGVNAQVQKIGRLNSFDGLEKFICA